MCVKQFVHQENKNKNKKLQNLQKHNRTFVEHIKK